MQTQASVDGFETLLPENTKRTRSHTYIAQTTEDIWCFKHRVLTTTSPQAEAVRMQDDWIKNYHYNTYGSDMDKCSCEQNKDSTIRINIIQYAYQVYRRKETSKTLELNIKSTSQPYMTRFAHVKNKQNLWTWKTHLPTIGEKNRWTSWIMNNFIWKIQKQFCWIWIWNQHGDASISGQSKMNS